MHGRTGHPPLKKELALASHRRPVLVLALALGALLLAAAPAGAVQSLRVDYVPTTPARGFPITFTANVNPTEGELVDQYEWNWGDGAGFVLGGREQPHTFSAPGVYPVQVRVREFPSGLTTTSGPEDARVVVPNGPPTAQFQSGSSSPYVGQQVKFFSTSRDPEGDDLTYSWSGAQATADPRVASRTFTRAGIYAVSLRVTDEYGAGTNSGPTFIAVRNPPVNTLIRTSPNPTDTLRPLRLISPFPIVRFVGSPIEMGARVRLISVRAPRGAKVTVRCAGKSCPFKRSSKIAKSKPVTFPKMRKRLRAGTVVAVLVRHEGRIGRFVRFKIRGDGKQWRRSDLCVWPGSTKGRRCPAD